MYDTNEMRQQNSKGVNEIIVVATRLSYSVIECQDLHMLYAYFNTSQGIFTNVSLDKYRFHMYVPVASIDSICIFNGQ
jgi:hypothetical protein